MKNKILSISLLIILLPFITPNATMAKDNSTLPGNFEPEYGPVESGAHLYYNISQFEWGSGAFDLLKMLLPKEVPEFDFGLVEGLEGSEIEILITAMNNMPLYKWNETHGYHDPISQTLLQAIGFLNLYDDLTFYLNASQFYFPDNFTKTDIHYYYETWPRSDFVDNVTSSVFWTNFNTTFLTQFDYGWWDYNTTMSYWPPYDGHWPRADHFDSNELDNFAYELGAVIGYDIGYWGCEFSVNNHLWFDAQAALDGFYTGFFEAREDGFTTGETDFTTDRIPDKKATVSATITDMQSYARWQYYPRIYEDYYASGYLYQGAQVYFRELLYRDLYDNTWNTYPSGFVDGYHDGYNYYGGYWDGQYDNSSAFLKYTTWNPPPDPYYDDPRDSWEEGYNEGILAGYLAAYDDGYEGYDEWIWPDYIYGRRYLEGMFQYREIGYFDGFAEGAEDSYNNLPEDPLIILPFLSPSNGFEDGANKIYSDQYHEGHANGYLYETLVNSPNPLDWLWNNGPFYNINLPDFQFTFLFGSILPAIPIDITMFTDLNFAISEYYEYEFNYGAYDYWPFSERFVPFQTFLASDTNWTKFNEFDVAMNTTSGYESPGFNTTYDEINDFMLFEMSMNMSDPGITEYVAWGYDTASGKLLNVTANMDFYTVSDVWVNVTLELDDAKTETPYTPTLPTPSSWTYLFDNIIFTFEAPPLAPTDFIENIQNFKSQALTSIGHPTIGVEMLDYEGLWAEANYTYYNPLEPTDPPYEATRHYPMFSPMGFQIIPDWNYYDGLVITANSMLGATDYFIEAFNTLDVQNTNFIITELLLDANVDSYHYTTGMDVMYYYLTIDAEVDIEWDMMNGAYEWENTIVDGFIRGYMWVVVDYTSGVILGAGIKTSFEFEVTTVPDYGISGAGLSLGYLEILISANFASPPTLDFVLGPSSLPLIPEFGITSILSIIGFAAVASAVIFTKRRK